MNTLYGKAVESAPPRLAIVDALLKARAVLGAHRRIMVSVSGGSDSDIMLDITELARRDGDKVSYVFFDTGLEYAATKRHLNDLESKYGVTIERRTPKKTIPAACREYGIPFISKDVSDMLGRLQAHNFDWNDVPEEATPEKYGRCKSSLDWYFNRRTPGKSGKSRHNINRFKLLREFITAYPPEFKISDKCCYYAKERVSAEYVKENDIDLVVMGLRRAEGGRRAATISTCFSPGKNGGGDKYRPMWFWTDEDKRIYREWRGIRHSDCYEVWGMTRTGCVGCPCNSRAEQELWAVLKYEPNLVKAAQSVFGESYEYRRRYAAFKSGEIQGKCG
jgi:3'-phosphoadenosine 5'-phosphosulfate sulfotransferase (PAPS reductase)/FAD synthetase